jgi:RNA polymerase sigma-70 factor (ECF subfamily)
MDTLLPAMPYHSPSVQRRLYARRRPLAAPPSALVGFASVHSASNMSDLATTQDLVLRVREGDGAAREELLGRYVPALSRWAHGRLPAQARDLSETADLVQLTLIKALHHLEGFDARAPGAFLSWLRTIFLNVLKDELRRHGRRPGHATLDTGEDEAPVPVRAPGASAEDLASYESALAQLSDDAREVVVLSVEFGFSHDELARAIGASTPDAARMRLKRALLHLAELLHD